MTNQWRLKRMTLWDITVTVLLTLKFYKQLRKLLKTINVRLLMACNSLPVWLNLISYSLNSGLSMRIGRYKTSTAPFNRKVVIIIKIWEGTLALQFLKTNKTVLEILWLSLASWPWTITFHTRSQFWNQCQFSWTPEVLSKTLSKTMEDFTSWKTALLKKNNKKLRSNQSYHLLIASSKALWKEYIQQNLPISKVLC